MLKPPSNPLNHLKHYSFFLLNHLTTISGYRQVNDELNSCSNLLRISEIYNSDKKLNGYSLVSLIRTCTQSGYYSYGQQLHSYVLQSGFGSNGYVSTALVNFYVKFEFLDDAHKLFDEIPEPNVVSWNSLICGHVHCGEFSKALCLFMQLEKSGVCSDAFSFTAALAACGKLGLLRLGMSIHSKIVKYGDQCSVVTCNCLIDMYGKCGCVEEAIRLFEEMNDKDTISWNSVIAACARNQRLEQASSFLKQMPESDTISYNELINGIAQFGNIEDAIAILATMPKPDSSSWNSIITGYVNRNHAREALDIFSKMHFEGMRMDQFTFSSILSGIGCISALAWGTLVHCCSVRSGLDKSVVVGSALIDMYSKCGDVSSARRVFDAMVERDLLSWNSLISAYVSSGFLELAIELFGFMRMEGFEPDIVTWNTIMDAYCRMGQCDEASNVFAKIKEPNIISWTTLISGYSRTGKHEVTLSIFREMMSMGKVCADLDCLSSVLVSCRHIEGPNFGREIHAHGIKTVNITEFYKSAGPALLVLYATSRRIQEMGNVFNCMDKSDVVTWTAMIRSLAHLGMTHSALTRFREMQIRRIQNDQTTLSTVLPVCDLQTGRQIHAYIWRNGFISVITVLNALIHMYSKNGCNTTAYSVFLNMESRDVVSWNAMIGGFGMNGFGQAALHLLQEMRDSGIFPNSLTFTSVLSACSHSCLVDEGLQIFHKMRREFGFEPKTEHFACVVDLLARAGQLDDAVEFINRMPVKTDKCIWGAVLSASRAHQNVSTGVLAAENLVQLEPYNAGNYVTLSNMYVRAGRWEDAVRVRKQMDIRNLVKPSGYSFIDNGK